VALRPLLLAVQLQDMTPLEAAEVAVTWNGRIAGAQQTLGQLADLLEAQLLREAML
jgi:hypothetical protein